MGVHKPIATSSSSLVGFCVTLLLVSSCYSDNLHKSSSVQVVGVAKCSDCSALPLSGIRVTIDCKVSDKGEFKTRGVGELDKQGKFKVTLPSEIVKDDGALKEECFAQLHSASNTPCPTHQGLEASKLILKSKDEQTGKHTYSPTGEISISPITCTSAFFWADLKFPKLPPFGSPHFKLPPNFKLPPIRRIPRKKPHYPPPPEGFAPIYKSPPQS